MDDRRLLEPGFGGDVSPEELAYILAALQQDGRLCRRWGFRAGQRRFSEAAVRRVALGGIPRSPNHNARLIRRPVRPRRFTAPQASPSPSPVRRKAPNVETRIRKLAGQGRSYGDIAAALAADGLRVSRLKVAKALQRRLIA